MANEGIQHQVAEIRVKFVPDTTEVDRALKDIADKFGKIPDQFKKDMLGAIDSVKTEFDKIPKGVGDQIGAFVTDAKGKIDTLAASLAEPQKRKQEPPKEPQNDAFPARPDDGKVLSTNYLGSLEEQQLLLMKNIKSRLDEMYSALLRLPT